jgi:transcriptional regulator with XRE-family HTH domain
VAQAADPITAKELRAFAHNVRRIREQAHLYQEEMAELAEFDRSAISQIEGAKRAPKFSTLLKLARAAGVEPSDFFAGIGPPAPRDIPALTGDPPAEPSARFGANLKLARTHRELTKEGLALEAEVDRSTIGAIELGEIEPSIPKLLKLARALEIPPSFLFQGVH